jgi:protein-S-isoprenylcysteine O-methyltransferase Ste14
VDLLSHNAGHLWSTLLGGKGDPHFSPPHLLSDLLIGGGFFLVGWAWRVLHRAQRERRVAASGPYARMRHPQYAGFMLIMLGFLFQWPTLPTILMFPVLVIMYARLARREEMEALKEFGEEYARYAKDVPAFVPRLAPRAHGDTL